MHPVSAATPPSTLGSRLEIYGHVTQPWRSISCLSLTGISSYASVCMHKACFCASFRGVRISQVQAPLLILTAVASSGTGSLLVGSGLPGGVGVMAPGN